eukprot:3631460-Ditylum_brightwellii.AAC.1
MSSTHDQVTSMTFVCSQHKARNDEHGGNFVKMEGVRRDTKYAISAALRNNYITIQNRHVK